MDRGRLVPPKLCSVGLIRGDRVSELTSSGGRLPLLSQLHLQLLLFVPSITASSLPLPLLLLSLLPLLGPKVGLRRLGRHRLMRKGRHDG